MPTSRPRALVTGASSGIGAAYACQLAARGYDLFLVARREAQLHKVAEHARTTYGGSVDCGIADLSTPDGVSSIEHVLGTAANITLLANIAGVGALGQAAALSATASDAMLAVNIGALTRLSHAAARRFSGAKSGTIVNFGSILSIMPLPGMGAYAATKAYVQSFTQSLQAELRGRGVRVQLVMPGLVTSEFYGDTPPPFPRHLYMSAETLAMTALAALDMGEDVTLPGLDDVAGWDAFELARKQLGRQLIITSGPAARYDLAPYRPGT